MRHIVVRLFVVHALSSYHSDSRYSLRAGSTGPADGNDMLDRGLSGLSRTVNGHVFADPYAVGGRRSRIDVPFLGAVWMGSSRSLHHLSPVLSMASYIMHRHKVFKSQLTSPFG